MVPTSSSAADNHSIANGFKESEEKADACTEKNKDDNDDEDEDDDDVAFASMDFGGVDFDGESTDNCQETETQIEENAKAEDILIQLETDILFQENNQSALTEEDPSTNAVRSLAKLISQGEYLKALSSSPSLDRFLDRVHGLLSLSKDDKEERRIAEYLQKAVQDHCTAEGEGSLVACIELEFLAVAALNLFLQLNYTGPSLDQMAQQQDSSSLSSVPQTEVYRSMQPHSQLSEAFQSKQQKQMQQIQQSLTWTAPKQENIAFHNVILAELAVDGEWPCPVCQGPYFLWLARCILSTLTCPDRLDWSVSRRPHSNRTQNDDGMDQTKREVTPKFLGVAFGLKGATFWNARAVVAHERLLQSRQPTVTLWEEAKLCFRRSLDVYCGHVTVPEDASVQDRIRAATTALEWGLAQHHFDRPGKGKLMYQKAKEYSGLSMNVTGALGKRTKYQQESKAQMLVQAESTITENGKKKPSGAETKENANTPARAEHPEDEILLERINFENEQDNEIKSLTILDQAIVLSFCLDVKNHNPADGLTLEEMGAYLARVLGHHDDWMVYSTALLERSWLDFESSHGRERSLLQMQALLDQHTSRLTLTQSTFDSVESSAPPQERLSNLHTIVYPPRWALQCDVAERYSRLGVVTSAAELFQEIELWDEVVECYRRAGKEHKAEQIVRERLEQQPTPRMWTALGDLTKDPQNYQKALDLSNGRYSYAYVALGHYHFDRKELQQAAKNYRMAVRVRPLSPGVWFRLGTVSMQLKDWDTALQAFSEVVQQEPQESDAWANVAAVHMQNKRPAEAYPALLESLKYSRNNWRVWLGKLYTCIDLDKFDEAVQACHTIMDLRSTRGQGNNIPELEEKCVRAIVGGSLQQYQESSSKDAARRTLARVHNLLDRLSSQSKTEAWIWETVAFFNEHIGQDKEVLIDNLMKEYRALTQVTGWEKDTAQSKRVVRVVSQIAHLGRSSREGLTKSRYQIQSVIQRIEMAYLDPSKTPPEAQRLKSLLEDVETSLKDLQS